VPFPDAARNDGLSLRVAICRSRVGLINWVSMKPRHAAALALVVILVVVLQVLVTSRGGYPMVLFYLVFWPNLVLGEIPGVPIFIRLSALALLWPTVGWLVLSLFVIRCGQRKSSKSN
jgi:hypothetical protein